MTGAIGNNERGREGTQEEGALIVEGARKDDPLTVTVRIMSREYTVACPAEEHEALVASADYLNERMTGIRRRGKALGAERIRRDDRAQPGARTADAERPQRRYPAGCAGDRQVHQLGLDIDHTLNTAD